MSEPAKEKAAFYDLDGTLLSCNLVSAYAYYARNDRSILKSLVLFARVLLAIPLLFFMDLYSRSAFNLYFFHFYRGMNRDRLIGLSDDLFEVTLKPSIYPRAEELVRSTRAEGFRNVLITGALDFTVRPIQKHFQFDDVICNHLEFRDHIATGQIVPPLVAEGEKARLIREYAARENIDLDQSRAFSDSVSDVPMLKVSGLPTATNPCYRLRRLALREGWQVLDLN
ncbi:MAG: HAD family hydrolase [Acidobacteriota bacterium]